MLNKQIPLVLDLDGTLIRTDTFHEMMVGLLIQKPWRLLALPFWFLKGRAYTKARLVKETTLSPYQLPYNPDLLTFAKKEASKGRPIYLATGSDQRVAQDIADHVGFFQDVMGSNGHINLTGPHKKQALLEKFGVKGFDYAGDSLIDLHVWGVARKAIVVHPKKDVLNKALKLMGQENTEVFPREKSRGIALVLAFRPLFWACNLLAPSWSLFLGFCLLSSGLFIGGDIISLYKERAGSYQKSVFAEGHLHLITGFLLAPLLILSSLFLMPLSLGLYYIPLFIVLDHLTRPFPQALRWIILSAFQLCTVLFLQEYGF